MTVTVRRLVEIRDEDDRTQEALDFLEAVADLCRERGFAIAHEKGDGRFEVYRLGRDALEPNLQWLLDAAEVRWLADEGPAQ